MNLAQFLFFGIWFLEMSARDWLAAVFRKNK
jgi:hypothetical protein